MEQFENTTVGIYDMCVDISRAKRILSRGLKLRCPACGRARLYRGLFKMRDRCSVCDMVFQREQGYFIGAIYVNVIATESLIFFAYLLSLLVAPSSSTSIFPFLFVMALVLPIIFHHHARSLWLAFDYIIDPPEKPATIGMRRLD